MKNLQKFSNLAEAKMDTAGRALLLGFKQDNGSLLHTELELDFVPTLLKILYGYAQLAGEHQPPKTPLPEVPLDDVLLLPAEEIEIRTTPTGAIWFLTRTGRLDTAIALPDFDAGRNLAKRLMDATK